MRTLIVQCKGRDVFRTGKKKKLYACFVAFKKAFDTVPHDLLWQAWEGAGMGSKMLRCIQSIYDTDTARVHTQQELTDTFRCTIGVKQGCPMSPNLFGQYLDDLQAALQNTPNSDCPMMETLHCRSCCMQMIWPSSCDTHKKSYNTFWTRCRLSATANQLYCVATHSQRP